MSAADLAARASADLEEGKYDSAVNNGNQALALLRDQFDSDDIRAEVAATVASAYLAGGDLEGAGPMLEEELKHFRRVGHNIGELLMLTKSLEWNVRRGNGKAALDLAPDAKKMALKVGDDQVQEEVMSQTAKAHILVGDSKAALDVANDLLSLAKGSNDKNGEATAWMDIAEAHAHKDEEGEGDPEAMGNALAAAKKALAICKEAGLKKAEASTLSRVASMQLKMGHANEALKNAKDAKALCKEIGASAGVADALETIVHAQHALGNARQGVYSAKIEFEKYASAGDKRGEARALGTVVLAYSLVGDNKDAITYGKRAIDLWGAQGQTKKQAEMMHIVSKLLQKHGQHKEAIAMAQNAQSAFKQLGSVTGLSKADAVLDSSYVTMGRPMAAPGRKVVSQALSEIASAVEAKDEKAFLAAREKLEKYQGLYEVGEIYNALSPMLEEDREGTTKFLKKLGWTIEDNEADEDGEEAEDDSEDMRHGRLFDHTMFYFNTVQSGMNFGPQFRSVHPGRRGVPGKNAWANSSVSMVETEAEWTKLKFRPGILDSSMQHMGVLGFPPTDAP